MTLGLDNKVIPEELKTPWSTGTEKNKDSTKRWMIRQLVR